MPWARPRLPLFTAALFDAAGLIGLAVLATLDQQVATDQILSESKGLILLVVIYCSLGWLFGSYTLLKLPRVRWAQAITRLGTTSVASIITAAVISYIFRLQITSILFFRSNLIPVFFGLSIWSGLIRVVLRRNWPSPQRPRWQIAAMRDEISNIEEEWTLSRARSEFPYLINASFNQRIPESTHSESLALSSGVINNQDLQPLWQEAISQGQPVFSLVEMAEQELQRIPARWVGNQWLLFSGVIDGQRTNLKKQLKRYSDVVLSFALLIITAPVIAVAMVLVKLEDGGEVIYRQQRSGLLGHPFEVLKIRTMSVDAESTGAQWAKRNDQRITTIGYWLRRTRIDELPQLINVLKGEMSLIGPRPERPDIENILEKRIPNYRLRHWIRPGLSGWAQVNMPYAASISDSELKLSYDLFYLRNASTWLDLLILFKTIKIVLKAAGR